MRLTIQQRIELVELYYEKGRSPTDAIRAYCRINNVRRICDRKTVEDLIKKFKETGSVHDAPRKGRPTISDDTVMEIAHVSAEIAEGI